MIGDLNNLEYERQKSVLFCFLINVHVGGIYLGEENPVITNQR